MTCDAKIRPFPNATELTCAKTDPHPHDEHSAVLRDYAYQGSRTVINWQESDRRTFRGLYIPCGDNDFPCVLPDGHSGRHAP